MGNDPVNKIDPTGKNGVIPNMSQMRAQAYSSLQTPQSIRAAIVGQEYAAKDGLQSASNFADTIAVASIAGGQIEIAGPAGAMSVAFSIAANSVDFTSENDSYTQSNNATLAEGAGAAAGKAAENGVTIVGEAVGAAGIKGKLAEGTIKLIGTVTNTAAEVASQNVSDAVKEDALNREK